MPKAAVPVLDAGILVFKWRTKLYVQAFPFQENKMGQKDIKRQIHRQLKGYTRQEANEANQNQLVLSKCTLSERKIPGYQG